MEWDKAAHFNRLFVGLNARFRTAISEVIVKKTGHRDPGEVWVARGRGPRGTGQRPLATATVASPANLHRRKKMRTMFAPVDCSAVLILKNQS